MNLKWIYVVFFVFFVFLLLLCFSSSSLSFHSQGFLDSFSSSRFLVCCLFTMITIFNSSVATTSLRPKWSTVFIRTIKIKWIQLVNSFKWNSFSEWNFIAELLILLLLVIYCTLTPGESSVQRFNFWENEYNLSSALSPQ